MNRVTYENVRHLAKQALGIEDMHKSLTLQMGAFVRMGLPEAALAEAKDAHAALKRKCDQLKRATWRAMKGEAIYDFAESVHGLGPAVSLFLGNAPELTEFPSPAHLWSYCGLIPGKGRKKGQRAMYSPRLKAYAIARLAEPCVKLKGGEDKNGKALALSPYRDVYDARKARTTQTHPPMMEPGECEFCDRARSETKALRAKKNQARERTTVAMDCANVGGVHWTDGHRHADAMRVTAKAILLDLWLVENGYEPRWASKHVTPNQLLPAGATEHNNGGGHQLLDAQEADAPSTPTADGGATIGLNPNAALPRRRAAREVVHG